MDCLFHAKGLPTCGECTRTQERTGIWLPLFFAKDKYSRGNETTHRREPARTPSLIGLTGLARSGKDTTADFLVTHRLYSKHSFAAPIREFVARILGVSLETLERIKEHPIEWLGNVTPRRMMQTCGTEWGRAMVDDGLWVKSAMTRARQDLERGLDVVVTDVRFDNEAEAIAQAGGIVVRVTRPSAGTASAHKSEAGISDHLVHKTIQNNGSLADLYQTILDTLP